MTRGEPLQTIPVIVFQIQEFKVSKEVPEEYFADVISIVSHANGVFRLTFGQQDVDNQVRPVVRVLIPANQLQNAVRSITGAANEIREKVQAQMNDGSEDNDPATG
ncbi:MAG: hypothetical protein QF510_00015 [Rhodospirillales bacterium]|nr:hypothetical protein [Rhodospirillales bacterium]